MSLDRIARKAFAFVVVGMVAAAVYFQAVGAVELLSAATLVPEPSSLAKRPRRAPQRKEPPVWLEARASSGDEVLARNPFDSVTGPLDREPIDVELPTQEDEKQKQEKAHDLSDPLNAEECKEITLSIVSESMQSDWSSAQLQGPDDEGALMRRVGDKVGDAQIVYIGFNALRASPAVWLLGPEGLCQALLFSPDKPEVKPKRKKVVKRTPKPAARPRRRGAAKVPKEISDNIQKVSDTEFRVERSVIDNILENQAQLMRTARIVPEQKDGKTVGIRLFGIRSETLLGTLGMQNGDRLEKINGFDMASPEKALEAYARLRTASKLNVDITRRGKPITIEYQIQ